MRVNNFLLSGFFIAAVTVAVPRPAVNEINDAPEPGAFLKRVSDDVEAPVPGAFLKRVSEEVEAPVPGAFLKRVSDEVEAPVPGAFLKRASDEVEAPVPGAFLKRCQMIRVLEPHPLRGGLLYMAWHSDGCSVIKC